MQPRALAILGFPTPPEHLETWTRHELGATMVELGRSILAGRHLGGTCIVPYPKGARMIVTLTMEGPSGFKYSNVSTYDKLPPAYVADIDSLCRELATKIDEVPGSAPSGGPAYKVSLTWTGEASGSASEGNLSYRQAVDLQIWGLVCLFALVEHGKMEVRAGERT